MGFENFEYDFVYLLANSGHDFAPAAPPLHVDHSVSGECVPRTNARHRRSATTSGGSPVTHTAYHI